MSAGDLAAVLHLGAEVIRKRLDRWRKQHPEGGDWKEQQDRGPREPQYVYRVGAIRDVLADLVAG